MTGYGSLMNLHFVKGPISNPAVLDTSDHRNLALFHVEMLTRGFYVAPRGMIALSISFGDAEAAAFIDAVDDFLMINRHLLPRVH